MKALKAISRRLHRYLGWLTGVVVAILCATGAILLVQPEVERLAEPERFIAPDHEGKTLLSLDDFLSTFEKNERATFEEPTNVLVARLNIPSNPNRTWYALVSARDRNDRWTYMAYVDPYTGAAVAYGPSKTLEFFRTVRRMHTSLCLNPTVGRPIVRYSTLIFVFILLTGLVRWTPSRLSNKQAWKSALVPSVTKGYFRTIYDLHNVLGFYATLVLLVLALTGCWISFSWFKDGFDKLIGYDRESRYQADFQIAEVGETTTSFQGILDKHRAVAGEKKSYDVFFPGAKSPTPICIRQSDGFYYADAYYWNQYTGELLGVDRYGNLPAAQRVRTAIMPLHRGTFWGATTRYIFLVFCVLGVLLAVTGYLLTLKRWDIEEKNVERRRAREAEGADDAPVKSE